MIDWRRAFRALRRLVRDPERTDDVFELVEAVEGTNQRFVARFRAHPAGARLLAERPPLLDVLADRTALAALPDGSFGRAYLAFMEAAHLDADGLVAASMGPTERARTSLGPEERYIFGRVRDMHDLWHVLTGYGRDHAGEAANLAFTHAQTRNRGVLLLVVAAALIGPWRERFAWQRYLGAAWRRGARAVWLPVARYEDLLPLPLDMVRGMLAIQPPGEAHPGGIVVGNRPRPTAGADSPANAA